ncbi:MAG TPA: pyridoxal-phosphate dependent enzyme [Bdellovibrionota bacterium]|nr:pyridoxal-phosphate dependent enzyme [Bdellovibrionota bacterium]
MAKIYENILECVGQTPIVKLHKLGADMPHKFYAKLEFLNPGASIKDRIALQIVEDAEASGELKPGGTIIECTSGNTGMGLAMVGAVKGYQCVFVMPDKVSDEKIKALRAFGARVITTPTAVEPDDPRSYYSVAKRLSQEIPNAFYSNQYHNPSNAKAHYRMTGPEIWDQMGDKIDYLVVATGTGGTISGTTKFLKEKNSKMKSLCVDPEGSVFYEYFKTGKLVKVLTTYKVEGFGEDFLPGAIDFKMIDEMVQVNDKECFQTARDLAKKEGLFVGGSCGGAVAGALKFAKSLSGKKTFLILLPDSGSRYLSKFYDDGWMRENRFLEDRRSVGSVRDVLGSRYGKVISAERGANVREVVAMMKKSSISQLPVLDRGKLVGLISEVDLLNAMLKDVEAADRAIDKYVDQDFKILDPTAGIGELGPAFREGKIVIVSDNGKVVGIVTKIDLVDYLSARVQ